ncbi:MAG: DNA repair protein RadC [Ferruginibacter sp.]
MEKINLLPASIKNWPVDDRPREKLITKGASFLSDSELLAILINNGNKEKSAIELAKDILKLGKNNLHELGKISLKEFQKVKGIGVAKAVTIAAALELGRRRQHSVLLGKTVIRNSKEIAEYLKLILKDFNYEVFAVIFLNRANKIKHFEIISRGGITGTVADPRMILKKAIEEEATSIILSHNHPSGNLIPSKADEEITQKIKMAATYFDIKILDHIIVSEEGYFSFADEGMI